MRQRNIKDLDKRIEENSAYMVREPREFRGRWHEVFGNDRPIYLEIGSGKGRYIMSRAEAEPDRNFIACEGREAVGLRILEKTQEAALPNVRVLLCYMDDCREFFEEGELDGIYLNFSDPWPKGRHAKRRLTYGRNLEAMMDVLKPGATIEFKQTMTSFSDSPWRRSKPWATRFWKRPATSTPGTRSSRAKDTSRSTRPSS